VDRIWSLALFTLATCNAAWGNPLDDHFFGKGPLCAKKNVPVIVVTDVSRKGEIDDTISLHMYRRLEQIGCIKVVAVVSIFGNEGASTSEVHENLTERLGQLDISDWTVLPGPENKVPFTDEMRLSDGDRNRLAAIGAVARAHEQVVIAELGPFTVSALLLIHKLVEPNGIAQILGIGGRSPGEHFSTGKGLPFAFRDMNVAEDRAALSYLLRNHPEKLWLVTYLTGIGARMLEPWTLRSIGGPALQEHAQARASRLKMIGYDGKIPVWDTWTTSYFLEGGLAKLGCRKVRARMRYSEGYKPSDSLQLHFLDSAHPHSRAMIACHR